MRLFRTVMGRASVLDGDEPGLSSEDVLVAHDLRRVRRVLVPPGVVGAFGILLYAAGLSGAKHGFADVLGQGLLAASSATAVGALLGLLFGIPRTLSQPSAVVVRRADARAAAAASDGDPAANASDGAVRYGGNSNFEQISDWLTKVLVGASLTQFADVLGWIRRCSEWIAAAADRPDAAAVSGALLVAFLVWGFFVAYLLARIALPAMLLRAESPRPLRPVLQAGTKAVKLGERLRAVGAGDVLLAALPENARRVAAEVVRAGEARAGSADYGRAKLIVGHYPEAADALSKAVQQNPHDTALVEDLMFSALYQPPPRGFEDAIAAASLVPDKSPSICVYLAAALGQKYKYQEEHGGSEKEKKTTRDAALDAITRALRADAGWKPLLASLLDPPSGSPDRDLEVFKNDKEFRDLLS